MWIDDDDARDARIDGRQNGDKNGTIVIGLTPPDDAHVTWALVSKLLRTSHGLSQHDWAAWLEVSRKTVQRWETGTSLPDDRVEGRLFAFCDDKRVFDRVGRGAIAVGVASAEALRDLLAAQRIRQTSRTARTSAAPHGLVGREEDLARLVALIDSARLVTLTGPGGVGKTRLALAAAAARARRAVVVPLAEIDDAQHVLPQIAGHLDLRQRGGRSLRDTIVRALDGEPMLLVLDNLEHLLSASPLVDDLSASCTSLSILATSRAPLRVAGEVELRLAPLGSDGSSSPAVALFLERAGRADPDLRLDADDLELAAEVCARLGGLPLAIELAAARLRMMSLADLHQRVLESSRVLARGPADRPAHQRNIEDTIRWSYGLLEQSEQRLLASLCWFTAGFPLDAAEVVAPDTAIDDLGALVDHSLVQRDGSRYRMLELVREFARARADELGDARPGRAGEPAGGAHFVEWALTVARDAGRVAAEYPNLRVALDHLISRGDTPDALRLATALSPYWDLTSMLSEARRSLDLVAALADARPAARAVILNWNAYFAGLQQDLLVAQRLAGEALSIWTAEGNPGGEGYARLVLGMVAEETGDLGEAYRQLEAGRRLLRDVGDVVGETRALNNLGEVARARGDLAEARRCHEAALARCRQLGDEGALAAILCDLAQVALDQGHPDVARPAAQEALEIAARLDNGVGVATARAALARCLLHSDDVEGAVVAWGAAARSRERLGLPVERRDRATYESDVAGAQARLGAARFAELWQAGQGQEVAKT